MTSSRYWEGMQFCVHKAFALSYDPPMIKCTGMRQLLNMQINNSCWRSTVACYSSESSRKSHKLLPENLPLDGGAPLLCAGITVYSPIRYYGLDKPRMHVGVVGLGGLGHVAVKFLKALGLKVTVVSISPKKKEEAISNLGADSFLVSKDQAQMQMSY